VERCDVTVCSEGEQMNRCDVNVRTAGEQMERYDGNALCVLRVNRWSDVMILLCVT
jgi:hypothetical protein